MKTLLSSILLLLACCQLNAQAVYPIFIESYKHMNIYSYDSETNMSEEIGISTKLNRYWKKGYKIISDALLSADFKFNQASDTLLIATSYVDWIAGGTPSNIYARSSKSVKLLSECDSTSGVYYEFALSKENHPIILISGKMPAFLASALSKDSGQYVENFFSVIDKDKADFFREFYLRRTSGQYPKDYYSMMYHADVEAFKQYYINNIRKTMGYYDKVLRVVIKDGKVVPPTLIWYY